MVFCEDWTIISRAQIHLGLFKNPSIGNVVTYVHLDHFKTQSTPMGKPYAHYMAHILHFRKGGMMFASCVTI